MKKNLKRLSGKSKAKRVNELKKAYEHWCSYLKQYNNGLLIDKWVLDEINTIIEELNMYGYHYPKY